MRKHLTRVGLGLVSIAVMAGFVFILMCSCVAVGWCCDALLSHAQWLLVVGFVLGLAYVVGRDLEKRR